jgi:histidinol-phosphatase
MLDSAFLNHALSVAKQASASAAGVIRRYYRNNVAVEIKADETPVTRADREAEAAIKTVLKAEFPAHGYYGEESAQERMDADFIWLIDPIDGTKSFVRNYPIFSTQIALMHKGELVLGVSHASEFGELASAVKGSAAELNAQPLHVRDCSDFSRAIVSFGNIKSLANSSGWNVLNQIINQAHRTRGYGDFYHYHLLAQGSLDLIIESDVNVLDIAALSVIVHAAGGVMTDLNGEPIGLHTRSILAGAPALHAHALGLLKGCVA